jgi:nitrite reductase/ring-hydroxylating ferredoxin subunit
MQPRLAFAMHFVVGPVELLPPGTQRRVDVDGRAIAIFNVDGAFYALRDICPHQGGPLSSGHLVHAVTAPRPGCYAIDPETTLVRCPWHGWEYELATGQSWVGATRVRTFPVSVETLSEREDHPDTSVQRVRGPYIAETLPITVEGDYVVIDV